VHRIRIGHVREYSDDLESPCWQHFLETAHKDFKRHVSKGSPHSRLKRGIDEGDEAPQQLAGGVTGHGHATRRVRRNRRANKESEVASTEFAVESRDEFSPRRRAPACGGQIDDVGSRSSTWLPPATDLVEQTIRIEAIFSHAAPLLRDRSTNPTRLAFPGHTKSRSPLGESSRMTFDAIAGS
jgi:hypothetical protein